MTTKSTGAKRHNAGTTPDAQNSANHNRVLYRKYRPTRLEDVIGQEQITTVLSNSIKQSKIAHAYLFIGPRGTGKTSVARIFAHAINGFDYQIEDSYLDIIEIDAASNTGVDNIREIREKAVIAPTSGKYKVYIIDEVHMLTKSASNALLKTLEEPPEHVIFIMATTDAHKVPITISSRTQVHTFRLAGADTMFNHLRKISDLEQIPITDDALRIVVRRGGGSFRDSLSLLDQVMNLAISSSNSKKSASSSTSEKVEITAELLNSALGLPAEQIIDTLLSAYEAQDIPTIHNLLQNTLNSGTKPEVIASECITKILDSPHPNLLSLLAALPEVQPPFPEAKLLLAFLNPSQKVVSAPSGFSPVSYPTFTPTAVKTPLGSPLPASPSPATPSEPSHLTPAKTPAISSESPHPTPANDADFDWNSFVEAIRTSSTGLANQLRRIEYNFDGQRLNLFPNSSFIKKILDKPEHIKIITEHLSSFNLSVHDPNEPHATEDNAISQISAIMGGVQEVKKDEMPF